jgi:xylose dehydrogenase (NAD/NADP)
MNDKKLRWGVLGCANIARKSVIPAIQVSETGYVRGIASRNGDTAREFATDLGIEHFYSSYQALLDDPDIDAVYIPLPNHLHYEWAIRAAEAGKHVLCEKPLALNAAQAEDMIQACDQAGVKLAEAFMYYHHPRYFRIKEIMQSGVIGEIRGIHGTFTFNNAHANENVRFHANMGGGSLYDVGCYPIHAARYLLGEEPTAVTTHAFFSSEHDNVDMMASGLLEFSKGVALTFDCGMWADHRNTLEILGTKGRIQVPSAFVCRSNEQSKFILRVEGNAQEEMADLAINQYVLQADDFGRSILLDKPMTLPSIDAVYNMKVLEACLESAKNRIRVTLSL